MRRLRASGIQDITDGNGVGASLLETYQDFGAFLDDFKQREGRGSAQRAIAPYIYLLLHSLAWLNCNRTCPWTLMIARSESTIFTSRHRSALVPP